MHRLLLVLPLLISACGDSDDGTDDTDTDTDTDSDTDADLEQALADLTAAVQGYESWPQSANWVGINPSEPGNHEAPYAEIWWNQAAYDTLQNGADEMPIGAVSTKMNYEDEAGTTPTYFFGMQKTENGWFFGLYSPDLSEAILYGYEEGVGNCYNCHVDGKDFVMAEDY